jgi:hypothetical protein
MKELRMDDSLARARRCHDKAEDMEAMALREDSSRRRQTMRSIAEHYFILHDKFVELGQKLPPGEVVKFRR